MRRGENPDFADGPPAQQVIEFILELDKLEAVERGMRPPGLGRCENSAEHSWQVALLATSLAPCAGSAIDIDRVNRMPLVHDIAEIDTSDTVAFVESGWEERKAAGRAAVTRIFGLLSEALRKAGSAPGKQRGEARRA